MDKYYGSMDGYGINNLIDLRSQALNRDYSYRPTFKFFDTEEDTGQLEFKPYYGLEFEINTNFEDLERCAFELLKRVNLNRRLFYCKRDGSVGHGFEFNSMPMTLDYMRSFDKGFFNDVFKEADAFVGANCGFHIHIDRRAFKDHASLTLFYMNMLVLSPLTLYMSKRDNLVFLNRYANMFSYTDRQNTGIPQFYLDYIKSAMITTAMGKPAPAFKKPTGYLDYIENSITSGNRYTAINNTNEKTVEVRIFSGTTNWDYAIDMVEFIDEMIKLCNNHVELHAISDALKIPVVKHYYEAMKSYLKLLIGYHKIGALFLHPTDFNQVYVRISPKVARIGDYVIEKKLLTEINKNAYGDETKCARLIDSVRFITLLDEYGLKFRGYRMTVNVEKEAFKGYMFLRRVNTLMIYCITQPEKIGTLVNLFSKVVESKFEKPVIVKTQTTSRRSSFSWGHINDFSASLDEAEPRLSQQSHGADDYPYANLAELVRASQEIRRLQALNSSNLGTRTDPAEIYNDSSPRVQRDDICEEHECDEDCDC